MNKINATGTPLEDCSTLQVSIKDGKYSFNATKRLIELKYKYRFKSADDKEAVREFYDRFCCNRKEA
jgi:hypothetical protein